MSLPKFTAEASLYTTGHYQVDRRIINSYRRTINAIHPAREKEEDIIGEEIIHVEDWGPLTEPYIGGSGGGITSGGGEGGNGGGGHGGGGRVSSVVPRVPREPQPQCCCWRKDPNFPFPTLKCLPVMCPPDK